MVDFKKMMEMSSEEREQRNRDYERRAVESDLAERAVAATDMRRLVMSDDPEIRYGRDGLPFAILRSEKDGAPYSSVTKPVWGEDERKFVERMSGLKEGDEIIAHGHEETRRWKDQRQNWKSSVEFQIDVPLSPDRLRHELPEGVAFPQTAYAKKQAELAQRQKGIANGF